MSEENKMTIGGIEKLAANYDTECASLEELLADLDEDLAAVRSKHVAGLKRQAVVVANRESLLREAIERSPDLFERPRTMTLAGVKCGLKAGSGKIEWDDDATVVGLIKEHRKKEMGVLIQTEEKPRATALKALKPEELQVIGCRIEGKGDVVVIDRVAGDLEKLVDKLIAKLAEAVMKKEK